MKIFLVFIYSIIIFSSCSQIKTDGNDSRDLSLENLKNIEIGTSKDSIDKKFGKPNKDIGAGLHIYVYEVDEKNITIFFSPDNKISKIDITD